MEDNQKINLEHIKKQTENKKKTERNHAALGMSVGLSIGILIGIAMKNLAIGVSLGTCIGMAAGASIKKK